jgi:hypothetical protein
MVQSMHLRIWEVMVRNGPKVMISFIEMSVSFLLEEISLIIGFWGDQFRVRKRCSLWGKLTLPKSISAFEPEHNYRL